MHIYNEVHRPPLFAMGLYLLHQEMVALSAFFCFCEVVHTERDFGLWGARTCHKSLGRTETLIEEHTAPQNGKYFVDLICGWVGLCGADILMIRTAAMF